MAARLYASGAVPSKKAACEAVGLTPQYLSVLDSSGNEVTNRIQGEVEQAIADETIGLSKVIATLSRKAVLRMSQLIQSQNEHVAVKAASDVLDRNPETSKTFKHTVSPFSLGSEDAKELAEALVAAARVKQQFLPEASKDFISVELANGNEAPKDSSVKKDLAGDQQSSKERTTEAEIISVLNEKDEGP